MRGQIVLVAAILLLLGGCASVGKSISVTGPVQIAMHGQVGAVSVTQYYSNAHILTYEDHQLRRDKYEAVEFDVQTKFHAFNPESQTIQFTQETIRKDGTVGLHEMAFPELHEQIDFVIKSNSQVLYAGRYPAQSLFFVPSLPLPEQPVDVGDTWEMSHEWISAHDGIPLRLEVVGIFKNLVTCEDHKKCVDLEINGHVALAATPTVAGAVFESRIWGRVLFSLERGDVLWSETRSFERMLVKGDGVTVTSCMRSQMKTGAQLKTDLACTPQEAPASAPPAI